MNLDASTAGQDAAGLMSIKANAKRALNELYDLVIYPPKELRNPKNIYRIGTFLTYFIDNNRTRYYDDSLIFNFDTYFYDQSPETTVERMKKIGLSYFLVDLNAATIDRDPRHDLTRRFEELLKTFRASNLELVQTDSPCLRMALEENNADYMIYAGVNYESYLTDGTSVSRGKKQLQCYNHILQLMQQGKIDSTHYPYLMPIANYVAQNKGASMSDLQNAFESYIGHGWLALFRIK